MRQASTESAQKVEHQVGEMAEIVLNVVAEDPEHPHIAKHMLPGRVHEHGCEYRQKCGNRVEHRYPGQQAHGVSWNECELKLESIACRVALQAQLPFEKVNDEVNPNQKIGDIGRRKPRLIVAQGDHKESGFCPLPVE